MTGPGLTDARKRIVAAARELAVRGLVIGTAGNLSVRVGDRIAITATGARFEQLTPEQVTVVDRDGTVQDGALAPTSELALHLGVYERFDTGAVVHTHAPMSTAVGLVVEELPCVHYQMLLLGGAVRAAPYAVFGSPKLAESVVAALEGKAAALMANHGAVTHAGDIATAVEFTLLLEWACTVYQRAAALGELRSLTEEQQRLTVEAAVTRHYGATVPSATDPSTAEETR